MQEHIEPRMYTGIQGEACLAHINEQSIHGLGNKYFTLVKSMQRAYDPRFAQPDLQLNNHTQNLLNNTTYGFLQNWEHKFGFQFANTQQVQLDSHDVNQQIRYLLKDLSRKYIQEYHLRKEGVNNLHEEPGQIQEMLKKASVTTFPDFGELARLNETGALISTPKLDRLNYGHKFLEAEKVQEEKRLNFIPKGSHLRPKDHQMDLSWDDID